MLYLDDEHASNVKDIEYAWLLIMWQRKMTSFLHLYIFGTDQLHPI